MLMAQMGWRTTFQVFAFAFFAIVLFASLLMKLPTPLDIAPFLAKPGSNAPSEHDVSTRDMFRRKSFWLYYFWSSILPVGGLVLVGSAAPIAAELGADVSLAALAAGVISVANGLGRVLLGAVYDRRGHRLSMLLCSLMELCSIVLLFFAYRTAGTLALILCFAALILMGLSFGGNPTVNSAFVLAFYGRSDYSAHLSILSTTLLASSFIGPPVAASMMASTGSYAGCIPFLLVFAVLSVPPALLVKKD
ncbi:MAG: MFS transporter [Eubacteriales bacterium]|nr:MFS transporter [Eubacteriales bacterium]